MPYETVRLETSGGVGRLTIDRVDKLNALNATVRHELIAALRELEQDESVRVVVLAGAGEKAFVAGADVAEFSARSAEEQRAAMEGPSVFEVVANLAKPTIARIHGLALGGGCELALACDIRIASRSARLGQPEIRLGLIPGGGGTQRLPRLVGYGQALRLILTGEIVGAEEAVRIGLVDILVEDADLERATAQLAGALAERSSVAVRAARDAVRAALELPLSAGLARERELFLQAFGSEDGVEGVRAFLEKRTPLFQGR